MLTRNEYWRSKGSDLKATLKDLPQFWSVRYYDFNVVTHKKHVQKLKYIHRNPVARGLVKAPKTGHGIVIVTTRLVKQEE